MSRSAASVFFAVGLFAVVSAAAVSGDGGVELGGAIARPRLTAAIVPFEVTGTKESVCNEVQPTLERIFLERGFSVLPSAQVVHGCQTLGIPQQGVVSDTAMLALARVCNVRYVLCGSMQIHSKRTWHWTGSRAKAWAYLTARMVDAQSGSLVLQRADFTGTDPDNLPSWQVVTGGSRTYREEEVVGTTLESAFSGFLEALRLLDIQASGTPIPLAQGTAPGAAVAPAGGTAGAPGAQGAGPPVSLTVSMANGDTVKGTLVAPDQVLIQAEYGAVRLTWPEISVLTLHGADTERPDRASLRNGAQVSGWTSPFTLVIQLDGGQQISIEATRVQSITVDQSAGQ